MNLGCPWVHLSFYGLKGVHGRVEMKGLATRAKRGAENWLSFFAHFAFDDSNLSFPGPSNLKKPMDNWDPTRESTLN